MDGLVDVQVLEALRGQRFKPALAARRPRPLLATPPPAHLEGLVEDVGDHALVHPVPSLQQTFGQIRHRAAVAELKGNGEMDGNAKRRRPTFRCSVRRLVFLGRLIEGRAWNPRAGMLNLRRPTVRIVFRLFSAAEFV